jgi:hypothetical protein
MVFASLTLAVALCISAIAAYYSIVGLATIFAAAMIPVIIMGTALEIGKITAAVWLKLNWQRAQFTYKLYLVPAVALLMFLTSMGIFGFLSKAHLDQTSASGESTAQIQRLDSEIKRRQTIIERAEERIRQLENSGTGQDAQTQNQIDREQARIDTAYKRIEPAVQEQNAIIDNQIKIYSDQIKKIDQELESIQSFLEKKEIAKAQAIVGVRPDGQMGPATTNAIKDYREKLSAQKQQLNSQIEQSNRNPAIQAARAEIARLRKQVETQVADSIQLINRLRSQVGKGASQNIDALVDEQQNRIKTANTELEPLIEQKYQLESQFRKLEAEVGPIKYIAELIYGDVSDNSLLEQAVRYVILIIVAVFDPLALVLILAAQQSFRWHKEDSNKIPADTIVKTADSIPASEVKEDTFDIAEHEYLNKPWTPVPSGDPISVQQDPIWVENCSICNSATINAGELGIICSNSNCTSYAIQSQDDYVITADSNLTIKHSDTIFSDPTIDVKIEDKSTKMVEAKRGNKVPTTTPPETANVRRKILAVEDSAVNTSSSSFGTSFPDIANAGDIFVRVDYNPNKLFKYNGFKWIEIDKNRTDSISFNDQYIDFLIQKIETGEYELENLSESEQIQIELRIKNQLNDKT